MRTARGAMGGVVVALAALCSSAGAADEGEAQPPEPVATPAPVAPGLSEAQRKSVIVATIPFGKDEGDGFWPLYRDYRRDVGKLQDQRAKVVAEYAEIFRTMTGDQAKSMVEDYLQADEGIAKLKRDYLKKFRKFLPETKVARVFMIDDKINAAAFAELMARVPVAGSPATQ